MPCMTTILKVHITWISFVGHNQSVPRMYQCEHRNVLIVKPFLFHDIQILQSRMGELTTLLEEKKQEIAAWKGSAERMEIRYTTSTPCDSV